jgi:tetratricopeptide (TPR) repeat protein
MRKTAVCLIFTIIISITAFSQENKALQDSFLEAEYFMMNEDYSDALTFYLQLYEKLPDNANIAFSVGVCYLNIPGKKNLSLKYLEAAIKNMSAKHKEGTITQVSAPYDALYELAKAYRINYKFELAKETFNKYIGTLLPDDRENLDYIKHEIAVCDMAKKLISKPVEFTEENIGELFNEDKSEFNPLISADGKSFAYMAKLKFYDAVMFSRLVDGKWTGPVNITADLQTDGDFYISCLSADGKSFAYMAKLKFYDAVMFSRLVDGKWTGPVNITADLQTDGDFYISCLSADGKQLFLSKDDNYNSDIYVSSFNGTTWSKIVKLDKNINTKYWESHGFVSDNGNQIIFASDKPGGFGGLDLYVSNKIKGGWGPAKNLGPEINTQFNEDRPFLINNGKTLFFCSQGHENIGGYDLFRADLQSNGLWSNPKNLGYPINTTDDDIFFMPLGDGKSGYRSLYKESEGFGKEDIYKITFK